MSGLEKPTRVITLRVAPEKLKAILDRPPDPARTRRDPLSVFNPRAFTPATPINRSSNRSRHLTAVAAASGAQGNAVYTNATFAAAFSAPSSSAQPSPQTSTTSCPHTAPEHPIGQQSLPQPSIQRADTVMAEKENQKQPAAAAGAAPANGEGGTPFYEEQRKTLKTLLEKRRKLVESIAAREEAIERKETEYLESTPAGNILMGFDNYTKGSTQAAAAQRRKGIHPEQYRVFSRSSVTYNPLATAATLFESGANTPASSSHAPTPVSSTFGGANTPTTGGGGARAPGGAQRDRKRKGVAVDAADSESDAREVKKVRTNFGAGRK